MFFVSLFDIHYSSTQKKTRTIKADAVPTKHLSCKNVAFADHHSKSSEWIAKRHWKIEVLNILNSSGSLTYEDQNILQNGTTPSTSISSSDNDIWQEKSNSLQGEVTELRNRIKQLENENRQLKIQLKLIRK